LVQGDFAQGGEYSEQALAIFRELDDRLGESESLFTLANAYLQQGDFDRARAMLEQRLRIDRETGARSHEGFVLMPLGTLLHHLGDYAGARDCFERCLHILQETGNARGQALALFSLGLVSHHQGDDIVAQEYCQRALLIGRDTADPFVEAWALTVLGHALMELGKVAEAAKAYGKAVTLKHELGQHHLVYEPLAGLARASLAQGDLSQAQAHVEDILRYLETRTLDGTRERFRVYLTCYRVLQANGDPRADDILETAYRLLQKHAATISDEEQRRSFLENVAVHREIASEYALVKEWAAGE